MTNEYKVYRVTGIFVKTHTKSKIPLMMEVRARNTINALERVYSEIGSRHKVKRREILIPKDGGIVEITAKDARSKLFDQLDQPGFTIYQD